MALFEYVAYDQSGAKMSGQRDAVSDQELFAQLKQQGLMPTQIKAVEGRLNQKIKPLSLKQLELFTSELELLLQSGVRIDRGIDIIRRTKADPALQSSLTKIGTDIRSGLRLSEALKQQPKNFDSLYCNLVSLGEESGNLSQVIAGIAADLKHRRELQAKLISALIYPAAIFAVCVLSIVFIFNFVVPKMAVMFNEAADLPWYTEAVLAASDWMQSYQWTLLLLFAVPAIVTSFYRDSAYVTRFKERWLLRLPVVSTGVLMVERIKFNSGLALMLDAGLKIDRALGLAIGNVSNAGIRKQLEIARQKIKSGESLSFSLSQTSLYPPFFVSLLEVGEESSQLFASFSEISRRSRQELDEWTSRLTALIEPVMILFMGGVVGSVVVVMLLSMVSVNDFAF